MSSKTAKKIELSMSPMMLAHMVAVPVINGLYSALKNPEFVEKLKEHQNSTTATRHAL